MEAENSESRVFRSTGLWTSNVYGATAARIGTVILISVMVSIVAWLNNGLSTLLFALGWISVMIGTMLALYPGKLIAAVPYAVELDAGKAIILYAPLKRVSVPIKDLESVRPSFLRQGFVVRLGKRHGLLGAFTIHGGFGVRGQKLARAIEGEIIARQQAP